jgi:GNAT superfamily N-acetyltransferase
MNNVIPLPRLEVRHGLPEDSVHVRRIVEEGWRELYAPHLPATLTTSRDSAFFAELAGDPGDQGWVATLGGRILGYGRVSANCIDQVWVQAGMRRRGIGSALLGRMMEAIRGRGFAFAQAGCEDFNLAARGFLEARGWRVIGSERQSLGEGRSCSALVYSHPLR